MYMTTGFQIKRGINVRAYKWSGFIVCMILLYIIFEQRTNQVSAVTKVDCINGLDVTPTTIKTLDTQEKEILRLLEKCNKEYVSYQTKSEITVSKSILKELYYRRKSLIIDYAEYTLVLDGRKIVNYENEFFSGIQLQMVQDDFDFIVNQGRKLPGEILIYLKKSQAEKKSYLYLYNVEKERYELLNTRTDGGLSIDQGGKYILSEEKRLTVHVDRWFVGIAFITIGILSIIYVVICKRHWFW